MKLKHFCPLFLSLCVLTLVALGMQPAWAASAATTTTLTVSSGGAAVASGGSVASGSKVTLTAAVVSGTAKVTTGQVNFCDATALSCTDIHLLGTAQLTNAGNATLNIRPSIGSHRYKAVFAGTPHGVAAYAASTSSSAAITATGTVWPTVTAIAQSGIAGDYSLTATVGGNAGAAPTGTVSFLDSSDSNAVLGNATLGADTAGLTFLSAPPPTVPASSLPPLANPTTFGDLNGDGILDGVGTLDTFVCTTDGCDFGYLAVLFGDGKGSFNADWNLNLGPEAGPGAVVIGDFNGDGIPDLAVGLDGQTDSTVEILLGNGDGTFTEKSTVPAGGNFQALAVGDFNGDGILDLAVGNNVGDFIAILLGNGDGTFTPSTAATSATSGDPVSILVGDFNGDSIPDLAVYSEADSVSGTLTILLGNGDGTFTAAPNPSPDTLTAFSLGDFNGDGHLDLALLNCPTSA